MKKAKGEDGSNSSMDMISELPKEILQRILYFLSQKDAVRTSILSKSWRYIWCTRPNLNFSDTIFEGNKQEFLAVVENSLQQYYDQRLCLEEFRLSLSLGNDLSMLIGNDVTDHESVSLLEKWIPLLTTMGVKEFRLSIVSAYLYVDFPSVVFKAESLKHLHLHNCKLSRKNIPENIPFDRLKVLRLYYVVIKSEILDKIISDCPLLTDMLFRNCMGLKTIKLEKKLHKYLKHFTFINNNIYPDHDQCSIEIDVPTIETVKIVGSKILFPSHTKFSNLKSLSLERVEISSNSIEQSQMSIDAPNIEYFQSSGLSIIPSISDAPTLRRSKLELCFSDDDVDNAQSWFLRLRKLLQALRHSEIFLNIFQLSDVNTMQIQQDILVQDIINGGNKPVVVADLQLTNCVDLFPSSSFYNGLFCICRPRKITHKWLMAEEGLAKERERKDLIEYFCNIRERGNYQEIIWQDLEDLNIEGFDMIRQEWQTSHWTTLSERALRANSICIRLKWSEACESSSKPLES